MPSPTVTALAERIRRASRLTILTGAGVSAASGVPTFRGDHGLWRAYRPEELATPEAFRRDPRLVWEWYAWRRELVAACRPNPAHDVIARWSQRQGCRVVTQNVDDLHLRAGTRGLVRLHGSLWELRCAGTAAGMQARCDPTPWRDERVPLAELPPRCPRCQGLARPDIVWFGESLAREDVEAALDATRCDVFIAVGTSAVVHPAGACVDEARRRGAITAEINLEATPATASVDHAIQGRAEEVLMQLDNCLR
jgi:NAD-dependent deacetylase